MNKDDTLTNQKKEILNLSEAKEILGEKGKGMTDKDIENLISTFQVFCDFWLDSYERKLFQGKTLKELLT